MVLWSGYVSRGSPLLSVQINESVTKAGVKRSYLSCGHLTGK